MEKTIDMTQGKPWKLLLRFSLSILIGYLFQQVYTLADRVIAGQFVGADVFSAVGSTTAITWLATALFAFWRYKGGKWKSKSLTEN